MYSQQFTQMEMPFVAPVANAKLITYYIVIVRLHWRIEWGRERIAHIHVEAEQVTGKVTAWMWVYTMATEKERERERAPFSIAV